VLGDSKYLLAVSCILYFKSVGFSCGFVRQSQLVQFRIAWDVFEEIRTAITRTHQEMR